MERIILNFLVYNGYYFKTDSELERYFNVMIKIYKPNYLTKVLKKVLKQLPTYIKCEPYSSMYDKPWYYENDEGFLLPYIVELFVSKGVKIDKEIIDILFDKLEIEYEVEIDTGRSFYYEVYYYPNYSVLKTIELLGYNFYVFQKIDEYKLVIQHEIDEYNKEVRERGWIPGSPRKIEIMKHVLNELKKIQRNFVILLENRLESEGRLPARTRLLRKFF